MKKLLAQLSIINAKLPAKLLLVIAIALCLSCKSNNLNWDVLQLDRVSGEWSAVATAHGFADNEEGCLELVQALSEKFPKTKCRCQSH